MSITVPDLNPDSFHSPERTAELGELLERTARVLAYAARPNSGGVQYPADLYQLLGQLRAAAAHLDSALTQCSHRLAAWREAGTLRLDRAGNLPQTAAAAVTETGRAAHNAFRLGEQLADAQAALAHIAWRESSSDTTTDISQPARES